MLTDVTKIKAFFVGMREEKKYAYLIQKTKEKYQSLGDEIPALSFALFQRVFEDGDRISYETPCFVRRAKLCTGAILSLIYPENMEYLKNLEETIWEILNEYYWGLPVHIVEHEKNESCFIDLFAAETGCAMAEIQWLLKDRLSPLINARIEAELERRIFTPFEEREFWWFTAVHNWAAVCAGNVAVAMMRVNPKRFFKDKPRFDKIFDSFLSGYDDDGVCKEGLHYWYYGFGSYMFYADMLERVSGGQYQLTENPKVQEIARFINKALLGPSCPISVSDGDLFVERDWAVDELLATRFPDTIPKGDLENSDFHFPKWLYFFRLFVYWQRGTFLSDSGQTEGVLYKDGGEQYVKKTKNYAIAIKAGHNDEPHNHNDIGSFILVKDDKQILCDLGRSVYTREYFEPETRYDFFCNSSLGHSVPIVDGTPQAVGREYVGTLSVSGDTVTVDMTKAYPTENLTCLTRTFVLKEDGITMTDRCNLSMQERLIGLYPFTLTEEGKLQAEGVTLCYDKDAWEPELSEKNHLDHNGKTIPVYVCDFKIKDGRVYDGCFRLHVSI